MEWYILNGMFFVQKIDLSQALKSINKWQWSVRNPPYIVWKATHLSDIVLHLSDKVVFK